MRLRLFLLVGLVTLLSAPASVGAAPGVSAFFYPWYGTPALDGGYQHWQQRAHDPPASAGSNYWPARGLYSSSDRKVLAVQMAEIRRAGISDVAVSWWGRGSVEDARLPAVGAAARAQHLTVSVHIEPYEGRNVASTAADIAYLRSLGVTTFFVYRPFEVDPASWAPLNDELTGVRVFAQTSLVGQALAGHFDGVYTYDILVHGGDTFGRLCRQAHAANLLCAPAVGPGCDAGAAGGAIRGKPRKSGVTYGCMWRSAIAAGAGLVATTSYNEWHEGTQIEPARPRPGSESYAGAWGEAGTRAETAYLDRTTYWARRFGARRAPER